MLQVLDFFNTPSAPNGASYYKQKVQSTMAGFDYSTEAELFPLVRLRRKFTKGGLVGYKRFASAAEAIRFAVEQLPPDLLRGAYLEVAEERFDASGIRQLYESDTYPLVRRA